MHLVETSQLGETKHGNYVWAIVLIHWGVLLLVTMVDAVVSSHSSGNRSEPFNCATSSLPIGLATGQVCILGSYLACAYQSFAFRLRWTYRLLACQWFCFTIPYVFLDYHYQWLISVAIDQLLVATAAFLATGILRWVTRCTVARTLNNDTVPKSTMRVADLLILMTIIAMMIALGMRYRSQTHGWEGLLYMVIVIVGVMVGCPIGAILPLCLIGLLTSNRRIIVTVTIVLSVAILSGLGYLLTSPSIEPRTPPIMILIGGSMIGPTLLTTLAFRRLGYRFRKLTLKTPILATTPPSTEALI